MDEPEKVAEKLRVLEDRLELLKSREKIEKTNCCICGKPGCDSISFKRRRPVHSECHEKDMLETKENNTS